MDNKHVAHTVRCNPPALPAETNEETKPAPKFHRVHVETPGSKVSDYGRATMASARWRSNRGPCLGSARMYKSNDGILVIDQYGQQCSVLHRTERFNRSRVFAGAVVSGGSAPWDEFEVIDGELGHVVSTLAARGWKLVANTAKVQLELLPDGISSKGVGHV